MKPQNVMLAVPTMSNRVTLQIVAVISALQASSFDPEAKFKFRFAIQNGFVPVDYARNTIVGIFLRSDCEKLWFMDEDMLPEGSVARLVHSDADIVCARMYKFDHPNPTSGSGVGMGLCAMMKAKNNLYVPLNPSVGEPAVQDVDSCGTGCTVIRREVIEDRRMWMENTYTTVDGKEFDGNVDIGETDYSPNLFTTRRAPNGKSLMGEDVDFTERAKKLGYSIQVDLNAVCGHFKSIDIDQAGVLAQETVKRVVNGITLEDGRVLKLDTDMAKTLNGPTMDKAVHAGDFAVKSA